MIQTRLFLLKNIIRCLVFFFLIFSATKKRMISFYLLK
ncbi:hypothetical protein EVA_01746 [gut metagenome]|uniref:Uncharacterized protein n=1 Tax=gut metagenome TaxID=749906 RepID=J9H7E7_9ZZZZ